MKSIRMLSQIAEKLNCLLNNLFRLTRKKTSKLSIVALLWGESTGFPHKEPAMQEAFSCYDVIMKHCYLGTSWSYVLPGNEISTAPLLLEGLLLLLGIQGHNDGCLGGFRMLTASIQLLKTESHHNANFFITGDTIMTTSSATSDNKVGIMTAFSF